MTAEKLLSSIFTSKKRKLFSPGCISFHNRIVLITMNKCTESFNRPTWKVEIKLDTRGVSDRYEIFRVRIYDSVTGLDISSNSFEFSEYFDPPTDIRIKHTTYHIWKCSSGYDWYIQTPSSFTKILDAIQGYIEGVAS